MINRLILVGLLSMCVAIKLHAEEAALSLFDFSGGLVTNYSSDRIPQNATPDCLNVTFSKDIGVVPREGSLNFLSTALSQSQSVRQMYEYIQSDGDKYMIFNSSWSCYYALSDGIATSIKNGLSSSYNDSYTTAGDYLYRDNGYDDPGKWDGTTYTALTVANSTSVPKGRFIYWYNNVLLKAGMTNDRSRFYWSVTSQPDDFGSSGYGWKFIAKDDGDNITGGLKVKDTFIWTKDHSTWELVGKNVATWQLTCLDPNIGCLYGDTLDIYQGMPIMLSHLGVVIWTGSGFKLISEPIDNEIKSLRQLDTNSNTNMLTTTSDWGDSTAVCTNVDTTTYSGSVAMLPFVITSSSIYISQNSTGTELTNFDTDKKYRQGFRVTSDIFICQIDLNVLIDSGDKGYVDISIADTNMSIIVSSMSVPINSSGIKNINITPTKLTANTSYYLYINDSGSTLIFSGFTGTTSNSYAGGSYWYYDSIWNETSTRDFYFKIYNTSDVLSSYTTKSVNAGSSWGSWGTFTVDDTIPSNSAISYYAVTSTSTENLATNTAFALTDGGSISSAVGPYIKVISSFTRTDATAVPKIDEIRIQSYGTNNFTPVGKVFNDEYWLFVSTDSETQYNNVVYVYDRYGRWTKYNNIYAQSACVYLNKFYTGNSNSDGTIKQRLVPNIYTDDGSAYEAYYKTPWLDAGHFMSQKIWNKIYTHAENSGGSMGVDYQIDGYTTSFTTNTVDLSGSTLVVNRTPIANQLKSYFIQLKARMINGKFNLKGWNLIYDAQPVQ
jgi:hypothetical protein